MIAERPALQARLSALIRALGLLEPDRTPCGQPLSPSAAHALTELATAERLTQTELGGRLRLEKSTVSRLVSQLEQRGWIARRRPERDGRLILLGLTESGRRLAEQVAAARAAFFDRLVERIPGARRAELLESLDLLVEVILERR